MESDFSFIPYYKDLLLRKAPKNITVPSTSVPIKALTSLGKMLRIDSLCLFLINDSKHTSETVHIYGDVALWRSVSLRSIQESVEELHRVFKKYRYFEIKHLTESCTFVLMGYLACHCPKGLSDRFSKGLEVYCILLGDYFARRLISGQLTNISRILSSLFEVPNKWQLPGTILHKASRYLFKLARFNYGIYCSVYNNTVCVEYYCKNGSSSFYRNPPILEIDTTFIHNNIKYHSKAGPLSCIPKPLVRILLNKDSRSSGEFSSEVVPICIDEDIIGVWVFASSKNNPFSEVDLVGILNGLYEPFKNSYKYLFQRRFHSMIVNPIYKCRDTRLSHKNVFVIMPFTQDWSNVLWKEILQPTIREMDLIPIRADDLYGAKIMEDVWESILKAELIICDTTGRNPNVFYELGISHTLGKKVILLTQNIDDIPFDLQSYRHIEYALDYSGGNQLKKNLKKFIKETLSTD